MLTDNEIEHIAEPYLTKIEYALLDERAMHGLDEAMMLMVDFARDILEKNNLEKENTK